MLDDDLRAQLADLVRPVAGWPAPDLRAVARRARRRRIRRAAAGAAGVAAAVAIAVALSSVPGPPGRPGTGSTTSPPGPAAGQQSRFLAGQLPAANAGPAVAPYVVTIAFQVTPAPAVVLDAFTGRDVAVVNAPVPGGGFEGVAAAGDDRTFVLAAPDSRSASVRFYELRLKPDGGQASLRPLLSVADGGVPVFAVSPDGRELAYATADGIEVVSLATGASRSWTADGNVVAGYARDLSWAGDHTLLIHWTSVAATSRLTGIRLLDTSAPGSDLLASRLLVPEHDQTAFGDFTGFSDVVIAPDGSAVFATAVSGYPDHPAAEVVEYSARTGQALAVVTPRAGESGLGSSCTVLWTDPAGDRLTAECGKTDATGTIEDGHFTAANLYVPSYNFSTPRQAFIAW